MSCNSWRETKKFRGVLRTLGLMSIQGSTCEVKISSLCPFVARLGLPPEPLPYSPLSRDFGPHLSQGPPSPKRLSGFDEWTEAFCPYSAIHHFLQMYRIKDRQLSLGSLCSSDTASPISGQNSGSGQCKSLACILADLVFSLHLCTYAVVVMSGFALCTYTNKAWQPKCHVFV